MTTFVLVHGAFRGGWAWRRVRPFLVAAGHDVHAPSLSGCGERAVVPVTGLATWVEDLVGLFEAEDLRDVVLVAHSQGGVVVVAALEVLADRVAHVVQLDSAVPADGERALDLTPGPPPDPAALPPRDALVPARPVGAGEGFDPGLAAWTNARLTPTPFAPSLDPVVRRSQAAAAVPVTYACCARTPGWYPSATTRARLDATGTPYALLDADHDAPLTAPGLVADLLLRAAPTRE